MVYQNIKDDALPPIQSMAITQGERIWACPKPFNLGDKPDPEKTRLEFPSLIRFKGAWYCAFREGEIHNAHPTGCGRIIRSADARTWETVALLTWEGGDVREPKLSITAEGQLMVNTVITFVAKQPHSNGDFGRLGYLVNGKLLPEESLSPGGGPESDHEANAICQSVTWLSSDGENWSSAYACPSGFNTWRWDAIWHNGMGYSMAQWGTGMKGPLHRTRDGKSWRVLTPQCRPDGKCNEGGLAFGRDDTLYCLFRGSNETIASLGIAKPPYYQDWQWKSLSIDWYGDGNLQPIGEVLRVQLGGPKLLCLSDGRLVGAGRTLGPERIDGRWRVNPTDPHGIEDGRVTLFWVDPNQARVTRFAEMDGTSYPGLVEHEGMLWVSYVVWWEDAPGIYLAKLPLPATS